MQYFVCFTNLNQKSNDLVVYFIYLTETLDVSSEFESWLCYKGQHHLHKAESATLISQTGPSLDLHLNTLFLFFVVLIKEMPIT